jgi:hypothetical protein
MTRKQRQQQDSLMRDVAEKVVARKFATLDDLHVDFPHLTRPQLQKAVSNAKINSLVRVVRQGVGGFRAVAAIYGAPGNEDVPLPVTSVWELGERAINGLPARQLHCVGKSYSPLGSWDGY